MLHYSPKRPTLAVANLAAHVERLERQASPLHCRTEMRELACVEKLFQQREEFCRFW
jgi:hypothetical protein